MRTRMRLRGRGAKKEAGGDERGGRLETGWYRGRGVEMVEEEKMEGAPRRRRWWW